MVDNKKRVMKKLAVKRRSQVSIKDKKTGDWKLVGDDEELLGFVTVDGEHARVRISLGLTVQPKPFEAIRADVSVEVPCKPTDKMVDKAYEYAAEKCGEKLEALSATIKS